MSRRTQRLVHHARAQEIETCGYSLGLLQGEAIDIAAADEFLDGGGALEIEPQRFQRLASEHNCRLIGFAKFEIDALREQL